jgi:glutamine---fructose-6-phosphate transaminase (isomerizing)
MARGEDSTFRREILEQPDVLRRLLKNERATAEMVAEAIADRNPPYLMIAARGTSEYAARYGQYVFGAFNHLPVALATPALFTRYKKPPAVAGTVMVGISQSGETPDIVEVIGEARTQGALTVAITNTQDSPLAAAAEHLIYMNGGEEVSIGASKSYTASLMALAMLSSALSRDEKRFDVLATVPDYVAGVTASAPSIIAAAERHRHMGSCVVISRGYNHATAYEIALKLKELAYIHAEPYSSVDFRHGPVAMVERGFPAIVVVPEGSVADELLDLLQRLSDKEAELVVISASRQALTLGQTRVPLPEDIPEWVSPMVTVVPGQLMALGLSLAKGLDPDHPRELEKVTYMH